MTDAKDLQRIQHQMVASAHDESPIPKDVQLLYDWLEIEGWDELIADLDDGFAVNLNWFAKSDFSDGDLRAELGLSQRQITNQKRIQYVRMLIERAKDDNDGVACPTVHAYPIHDEQGRAAVIGCVVEVHGQAGPKPLWRGPFVDRLAFLNHLHRENIWLDSELDDLSDEYVLSLWRFEGPRSAR